MKLLTGSVKIVSIFCICIAQLCTAYCQQALTLLPINEFAKKAFAPDAQLIDLRTPEEYAMGHLVNAHDFNFRSGDFNTQAGTLDKDRPVLIYCSTGDCLAVPAARLQSLGIREIYGLQGGILKWQNAGMTVVTAGASGPDISPGALAKLVSQSEYVLVDYGAPWCVPCRELIPILDTLAEKNKNKLTLIKINADDNKLMMEQKNIYTIPYIELYHHGKLIWKHDGYIEEAQLHRETGL